MAFGCCSAKVEPDDGTVGIAPPTKRKCRDLICVIIFLAWWLIMFVIAAVGAKNGDAFRLLYGVDYKGKTCGGADHTDRKMIFYPRLNQDLYAAVSAGGAAFNPLTLKPYGICVDKCPTARGIYICNAEGEAKITAGKGADTREAYIAANIAANTAPLLVDPDSTTAKGPCWFVPDAHKPTFFRCLPEDAPAPSMTRTCWNDGTNTAYPRCTESSGMATKCTPPSTGMYSYAKNACHKVTNPCGAADVVPSKKCVSTQTSFGGTFIGSNTHPGDPEMQNPLVAKLKSTMAKVGRWAGDISATYPAILMIGGILSMVLGVVWLVLFKYCAGFMVWFVVWSSFFGMGGLAIYASQKGGMLDGVDNAILNTAVAATGASGTAEAEAKQDQQSSWKALAYLAIVLTFILLVMILFLRKKIKVSIGIIREASNCIKRQPLMIAFPIIPFIMTLVLFGYFCLVGGLIQSSGDLKLSDMANTAGVSLNITNTTGQGFEKGKLNDYMLMYHLFGVLWANSLINAIGLCTLAGATCRYYWSRNKTKDEMGKRPITTSFKNCFRYHFGSLVFGALIIAIVQFIRICLEYIDRQTKSLQEKSGMIKIAMKVVKCCMWCLEKIVKFISRNAYIMIAMKGKSFCSSTVEAFKLIWDNLSQVAVITAITNLLLLLAKVSICAAAGFFMITLTSGKDYQKGGSKELSAPLLPTLVTVMLSFFVANQFMDVYDLAIDTILLCFCEDKKVNGAGEVYMSDELARYIGKVGKGDNSKEAKLEAAAERKEAADAAAAPAAETAVEAEKPAEATA